MDKTLTLDDGKRFGGDTPCDVRLPANVLVKFTKLSFAHPKSNVRVEAGQTSTVPAVFSRKAFKNEKEFHYGPWRIPCEYVYISLNPQAKDEAVEFYFYRTVGMQP
ncbi:hypothetical protein AAVH_11878 [Aphelenchoides avenae]|nr:hypothetical protein AAVH_11878 [Aphelenchus avenae]